MCGPSDARRFKSCIKSPTSSSNSDAATKTYSTYEMKKVIFDEIMIREYPRILGDNPAVSEGAPITIGWEPINESVVDLDFFEYCRQSEGRRSRKKLAISVRKRANILLEAGYSLEQIVNASMEASKVKQMRVDSLKSTGWNASLEFLTGAAETTGAALKQVDVLGVGSAAGVVVGVTAAVGMAAGQGVADVTAQTGKMLVNGMTTSSKAVADGVTTVGAGVVGVSRNLVVKPVGKMMTTAGNLVTVGVTSTGKAMGTAMSSTGKALVSIVNPSSSMGVTSSQGRNAPAAGTGKRQDGNTPGLDTSAKSLKRRSSRRIIELQ